MKYVAYLLAATLATSTLAVPAFAESNCNSELKAVKTEIDLMGKRPEHERAVEHYRSAEAAHKANNEAECMAQVRKARDQIAYAKHGAEHGVKSTDTE